VATAILADQPIRRVLAAYAASGVLFAAVLELGSPYRYAPLWASLLLVALALAAEYLPVEISRNGLRISFTLPFLAGLAVAVGPTGALLTDMVVTLVSAVMLGSKQKKPVVPFWIGLNVSVSAISASCAGLVFARIETLSPFYRHTTTAALAFTLVYAMVNFLLISNAEAVLTRTRFSERINVTASISAQGMLLYCLASMAVAIFVSKGLYIYVPLMLVPIVVLRRVLKLRSRMYEHYYETVTALTLMLQRAHPYTHGHLERVSKISEEVALRLGLSAQRARLIREASVLHDIGKIAVNEAVLDKPAKLTADEFTHVKRHAPLGAEILSPVASLRDVVPWIRHHHERPDGSGYPDGLLDLEIPIESKIIAVVDAYDAMTGGDLPGERRSYRESISSDEALVELERCSGTQFDEKVVQAFKYVLESGVV